MVGVDLERAFVVGAIGYTGAFLLTGYWLSWIRDPFANRLARLGDVAFIRARSSEWIPSHIAWVIIRTIANLARYLLTCRRCLACEVILVWSWRTGWSGWSSAFVSMFVAVAVYELWNRPDE